MRISDWSSDVCSSDLRRAPVRQPAARQRRRRDGGAVLPALLGVPLHRPPGRAAARCRTARRGAARQGAALNAMAAVPEGFRYLPGYVDAEVQAALIAALRALAEAAPLYRPTMPTSGRPFRSEEHTSELQSLMRRPYAVFC